MLQLRMPREGMPSLLKRSPSKSAKVMKTHSFLEIRVKASDCRENSGVSLNLALARPSC